MGVGKALLQRKAHLVERLHKARLQLMYICMYICLHLFAASREFIRSHLSSATAPTMLSYTSTPGAHPGLLETGKEAAAKLQTQADLKKRGLASADLSWAILSSKKQTLQQKLGSKSWMLFVTARMTQSHLLLELLQKTALKNLVEILEKNSEKEKNN